MRAGYRYHLVEKVNAASRRKGSNIVPTPLTKGKSPDISGPFPITFSTHAPGVSLPTASCSGACVSWHSLDSRGSLDVWEKTVPCIPGNAALGFAPSVRHKVSRPAGGRQPETIGTARNRKCSAHRHIPRHRPAGGSFRHSNYNTHAWAAGPCGTGGNSFSVCS